MSLIGKIDNGFAKQDFPQSKSLALGFKKLRFAHSATAGDTGIGFGSLVTPPDMLNYGFVQPTLSALMAANILVYKNNVYLTSSVRGPLEVDFDYSIASNSRLNFVGFTALQDEVFIGKFDPVSLTGNLFVDGTSHPTTGNLAVGQIDFNTGFPFEINKYSSTQLGAVTVYRNGRIQARNVGNSPSGQGNYYEVPVPGGLGFIIRFNDAGVLLPGSVVESIMVIPTGMLIERPQNSMMASIDLIAGAQNNIADTVALLAGVPRSTLTQVPSNVDQKAFGDTVLGILNAQVPIVTAWEDFTLTGSWNTNTLYFGKKRRVGQNVEMQFAVVLTGAPNAAGLIINPPPGLTLDTVNNFASGYLGIGSFGGIHTGVSFRSGVVCLDGAGIVLRMDDQPNIVTNSVPVAWNSGDNLTGMCSFAVVEYGSPTQSIKEILGM